MERTNRHEIMQKRTHLKCPDDIRQVGGLYLDDIKLYAHCTLACLFRLFNNEMKIFSSNLTSTFRCHSNAAEVIWELPRKLSRNQA